MQKDLSLLLDRFKNLRDSDTDTIPPLLVTSKTVLDIVEYLSGVFIESIAALKSEVIEGVFVFAPEEE